MKIDIEYSNPFYYLVNEKGEELFKTRYYQDLQNEIKKLESKGEK